MFEWSITIDGIRPISKKNSKQIVGKRLISSKAYQRFEREVVPILKLQAPRMPYTGDVVATITIDLKGKITADIDNLCNSWLDTIQEAGVLANDDQVIELRAVKRRGSKDWRSTIEIQGVE